MVAVTVQPPEARSAGCEADVTLVEEYHAEDIDAKGYRATAAAVGWWAFDHWDLECDYQHAEKSGPSGHFDLKRTGNPLGGAIDYTLGSLSEWEDGSWEKTDPEQYRYSYQRITGFTAVFKFVVRGTGRIVCAEDGQIVHAADGCVVYDGDILPS